MIEKFIGKYSLSKSLRFKLIPQGKTQEYVEKEILQKDFERSLDYQKVKKIIDRYHRMVIESVLNKTMISGLGEYSNLYFKENKDDKEKKAVAKLEENMRKEIAKNFKDNESIKRIDKKFLIREDLPQYLTDESEKALVANFYEFSTYFSGFNTNRMNMYVADEKSTAISFRIVNQNLPKFFNNIKVFKKVQEFLPAEKIEEVQNNIKPIYDVDIKDVFSVEYFNFVLSQSGIDRYNQILGGYTKENGVKIQGLNEIINLHNQKHADKKIPKLTALYKQILSDRDTLSFIPEKFESDEDLFNSLRLCFDDKADEDRTFASCLDEMNSLICNIHTYDLNEVFVKNSLYITEISNLTVGSWSVISQAIKDEYDSNFKGKIKNIEDYEKKRRSNINKTESYSLSQLQTYIDTDNKENKKIVDTLIDKAKELTTQIKQSHEDLEEFLAVPYSTDENLISDDKSIDIIKTFLDSVKEFQSLALMLSGTGKEEKRSNVFYGLYDSLKDRINSFNYLYDKIRNYLTQKPYSSDKYKLTFNNSTLLDGWDKNKEESNLSVLFRKDSKYYLGIMNKRFNKVFRNSVDPNSDECYEKMDYKLLPGPNKMLPKAFLSKKGIDTFNPSDEIIQNYNKGTHTKGDNFSLKDCHTLINYFKDSIKEYENWKSFDFNFSDTETYRDISAFYREVSEQGYKINFTKIDSLYIDNLVEEGKLYLFQLYNKDFSEHSKGKPNLHTMYFKALFSEENLQNVVYKLNGGGELFYRKASIKKIIEHPKNQPVENKNKLNNKKTSCFSYDLIKDKRFTVDQFTLHFPITINFKSAEQNNINFNVKEMLREGEDQHIIGIDRGERHLIYVTVINSKGEIKEQYSLNEIVNEYGGNTYKTDYHSLLDTKEKDRKKAKQNWKTVENIKELKEGYISQVVHKICLLVERYDAIIAMEDLNSGFKNSRIKVEKQTYQKFEKMLIDKLNLYVNKNKAEDEIGGLLYPYQLTNKFESFKKMGKQNGIIFYIPAWLTSKIDPSTGFVDLLKPKYTSIEKSHKFIASFDSIKFNELENHFEFEFNYDNFERGSTDFKKNWTVCSNGSRIESFRNEAKNSEWDSKTIILTDEFKKLFEEYGIDYKQADLKNAINSQTTAKFYKSLLKLIALCLQMRNSETGTNIDYLISPVKNSDGKFYNSEDYTGENAVLPSNADANGAYHIAKKTLWVVQQIKESEYEKLNDVILAISNKDWLEFTQNW